MNTSRHVSTGAIAALTVCVALAIAAWAASRRWPVDTSIGAQELADLTAKRSTLNGCEDAVRNELRQRRAGIQRHAWTPAAIAALRDSAGTGWRWEEKSGGRFEVRRIAPRLEEWPQYATFAAELAGNPGLALESVELRADGTGPARNFTAVTFVLRFLRADAPADDAAQVPGAPRPVAPADLSAASRKIGPGPQLRPASASFRPDPPGPSAGMPKEKPNQPMEKP